jgi:deoxyhypusine synthase
MSIRQFMLDHYRHFNAASSVDAAEGWVKHLNKNGNMLVTLGGAMSSAELGISLAEMIRQDKVHALCCTGANLEEDLFNLVAHEHYVRIPNYRQLTSADEEKLRDQGLNRVTDTCIPEEQAIRVLESKILTLWQEAEAKSERYFPYEYCYQLIKSKVLEPNYQIDPKNSWLIAAAEKNLPIFTPGWEDSTLANIFVAHVIRGSLKSYNCLKSGPELMAAVIDWYRELSAKCPVGFFQIAGGISGDFPICVVPLIEQDLQQECPKWSYFCQISDSTTSYGSYSGAVPSEKISWGKLDVDTPSYVIESDATIVAPLIFNYVLESD